MARRRRIRKNRWCGWIITTGSLAILLMARGGRPRKENILRRPTPRPGRCWRKWRREARRTLMRRGKGAGKALPGWQKLTPHARARFLYALARQVQKHSRRLAVLETLDNGKPIRESRDIDIPLVARHFYYHAGWAQLLEQEFPGYSACGVV